ncbi:MAG TPA: arginine N-succinyltransferase [Kiritimatiellia bacterium]|nr:arginine N-succinyltransferase [Kiritimatiellia bacterium]
MNDAVETTPPLPPPAAPRRFGCLHLFLAVLVAVVLTAVVTFFIVKMVLFPPPFKPVQLNACEEQVLQAKLDCLDFTAEAQSLAPADSGTLEPEAYSETDADRTVRFSEKELNALLANNTDLADKLAIDLSRNLISAKLLIPLDEDIPILGGKTLRVKTGAEFSYANGKPVLMLRGVSIMGVALPNAWLGGLKNIDIIQEFGGEAGFWQALADGIEALSIQDGQLSITLKE